MAKSSNKTIPTSIPVEDYITAITNPQRKKDCETIIEIMRKVTSREPKMWGTSIIGFGTYFYKYETGREGTMLITGLSNRQKAITLYIMCGFQDYDELLKELGPHTKGKSCLYLKNLDEINLNVLTRLVERGVNFVEENYKVID